jgi:serine/threonine-protein kinase
MLGRAATDDHDNQPDMSDEQIAGRYRLIEPLGRGAMSSVWLAEDSELGRRVAVKLLSPAADRARFEREARAAASLSHPNLCSLYDYGEADGKPYMVLEYLPNGSLEERLQGPEPLPDAETTRIATEMAAGLAHAHGRGLVHRDLKPANVLFDSEGRAKIADFGIARMGTSGTLTEAGTVLGTASYISPEQAGGLPAGPASDVYSFGVILFRMLTGRLPFVAPNAMEVVRMHRDDPPPHVSDFRPDAPARLEALTTATLAKRPADRPADGTALLRELRRSAGDAAEAATMVAAPSALATAATQVVRPNRPGPSRRRRRASLAAIALAAAALLAGGVALALALSGGDSDAGNTASVPPLSLPTVATLGPTTSQATTTAPTATARTTTAATTTAQTTTAQTTTARTTTVPATVPTTTVAPPTTTVAPPTTTVAPPTTTAPVTTDTVPTTTAPPVLPGAPTTTTGP